MTWGFWGLKNRSSFSRENYMKIPGDRAIALPISQGFWQEIPDRRTPSAGKNVQFDSGFKVWQTLQNALQNAENLFFGCRKKRPTKMVICCLGCKIKIKNIIYMKKKGIPPKKGSWSRKKSTPLAVFHFALVEVESSSIWDRTCTVDGSEIPRPTILDV